MYASVCMKPNSFRRHQPFFHWLTPTLAALTGLLQSRCCSSSRCFFGTHNPYFVRRLQESDDVKSAASTHSKILKSGFSSNTFTGNHLINAYLRCQMICLAHQLFEEMTDTNVVTWTSLMAGYINHGQPEKSLSLFLRMPGNEIQPNSFTLATAINACSLLADLRTGRGIHARVETIGLRSDLVVSTSLIDMYGKSNCTEDARRVFDNMVSRNIVSWGSMISAYAQNARGHDALNLFGEFLRECSCLSSLPNLSPNHFMFSSVVNSCASLGRLGAGKSTHGAVIRRGHDLNDIIAGALVDMYAKSGSIDYSNKVFDLIAHPTVIPYTSMIVAAAKYGLVEFALNLFDEMLVRGIMPNEVTFLGVLHACSHSGYVDKGLKYLNSMLMEHGIMPSAKHYTCAVDMLGRAGRLDEAYSLSRDIQVENGDKVFLWTTLLSASRTHGRLDLAIEANKRLNEFRQDVAGAFVTMSNAYASVGNWENASRIRSEMKSRGIRKEPGCSWIEVKDTAHVFYSGDLSSCPKEEEVLNLLEELEGRMKERGYVGGSNGLVFVDVEEEAREIMVGLHSERLALVFGLISLPKGVTIRVMKNLRMCRDCHEVFKLISDIVGRDIVVRDLNRFHHFKAGSCTCGDYW